MSTALSMEDTARKKAQEKPQTPFRFIERDKLKGRSAGTMLPSRTDFVGRFNIKRIGENSSYIYLEDWFHTLSSQSTGKVVIFILLFVGGGCLFSRK